jgi:SAM-dependent methyltransferase
MERRASSGAESTTDAQSPQDGRRARLPSGVRWRLTAGLTERSRLRRYGLFLAMMHPRPQDRILDVGVTDTSWRSGNFLESNYPHPDHITAVGLTAMPSFVDEHPDVRFVIADGKALPFPDKAFDIGFSNAVVEHVGTRQEQAAFIQELVRTCKRVFVSTPNRRFPIDPHTLLPLVHWFRQPWRRRLYAALGQRRWGDDSLLNPLDRRDFASLFPPGVKVRIIPQRILGLTSVLVAVVEDDAPPAASP